MKLLSFNIKGVGSRLKRNELQELVRKNKVDVVCLQETKIEDVSEKKCRLIWGSANCGWAAKDSQGRA